MEEKLAIDERSGRRHTPASPNLAAPWLVIPFQGEGKNPIQAFYNISEPNNKTIRKCIPELNGRHRMYQKPSHQGWVVVYCDDDDDDSKTFGNCFLWNPLSLETIELPNFDILIHDTYGEQDYRIHDCVLSSPPQKNKLVQDSSSIVYFIVSGSIYYDYTESMPMVAFCRVGDSEWSKYKIPERLLDDTGFNSIICFQNKIYIMGCDYHYQLVVTKLPPRGGNYSGICLQLRRLEVSTVRSGFSFMGAYSCLRKVYFLESDGELFRAEMVCLDRREYLNLVVSLNMSRLDFSKMSWEEVSSLGDTVLFLGQSTYCFFSAAALGLSKGCIYYTLPKDQSLYMFDVEDKCTKTIFPCSNLPTPCYSSQWFMMPSPTRSVPVEGRILGNMSIQVSQENYLMKAKETKVILSEDDNENPRKKQKKENQQEPRPWGVVHVDIVESIANNLHPVDFLHFRAVCKANLVPIPKQISGPIRSTGLTPWLLFSTENATRYNFVDPMHYNEKYFMRLPELLAGAIIRCQKGGWLLMSKGRYTLFFYNPFTKEVIHLPGTSPGYELAGVTFSSLPTSSDCVVIGITQLNQERICRYMTRRGADTWICRFFQNSDLQKYIPTLNAPLIDKETFFCVDFNGTLGVMHDGYFEVLERPCAYSDAAYVGFLVKCETELLLVQMLGMSVTIYKLEIINMVWQKVKSLGKHMLFISFTSCLSAVAPKSCMENKVYFPRLHDGRVLYYSLDTNSYHSVGSTHSSKDYFDTTCWTNCTWIEPNWSRSTSEELNWLNKNPL